MLVLDKLQFFHCYLISSFVDDFELYEHFIPIDDSIPLLPLPSFVGSKHSLTPIFMKSKTAWSVSSHVGLLKKCLQLKHSFNYS